MKNDTFENKFNTRTGWLCLDFANTVGWHASSNPEERLRSYRDLVSWAKQVSLISHDVEEGLIAESENKPILAEKVLTNAIELREAIYHIFSRETHSINVDPKDMFLLNTILKRQLPNMKLISTKGSFEYDWKIRTDHLDSILGPVVWSATNLLTSDALQRVGECADESGCGWLFWDNSRNKTRRWCDMTDCGNRAKSKRHYQKSHTDNV